MVQAYDNEPSLDVHITDIQQLQMTVDCMLSPVIQNALQGHMRSDGGFTVSGCGTVT